MSGWRPNDSRIDYACEQASKQAREETENRNGKHALRLRRTRLLEVMWAAVEERFVDVRLRQHRFNVFFIPVVCECVNSK